MNQKTKVLVALMQYIQKHHDEAGRPTYPSRWELATQIGTTGSGLPFNSLLLAGYIAESGQTVFPTARALVWWQDYQAGKVREV